MALTLESLDSELEAASQVHRKAAETLHLRQEQFERGRSGAKAAALQGQLELARLQSHVAELELAQADETRTAARERLDDEDLLPVRNSIAAESWRCISRLPCTSACRSS